jgi:death-on-curing protein
LPNEPVWLPVEQAIFVNQDEVAETGEPHVIMDMGKLESAFGRPQNHFHYDGDCDVLRLAVILMLGIAQAHAFEQGNKRTAWTCGMMFLRLNGYELTWDDVSVAEEFVKLVNHEISIDRFEEQIVYFIRESD